jgi:hypothetical protein
VTVFIAGLAVAGAVERIRELFGCSMLTMI